MLPAAPHHGGIQYGAKRDDTDLDNAIPQRCNARTLIMLLANAPVVFLGKAFADRLPVKVIQYGAAVMFTILGVVFLLRAAWRLPDDLGRASGQDNKDVFAVIRGTPRSSRWSPPPWSSPYLLTEPWGFTNTHASR